MAPSRTLRCRIASIVALALLFTQLALAAHACPRGSAEAPAASMAGMPCEQAMTGTAATDPDQPALCFAHCQGDAAQAQPDSTPALAALAPAPVPTLACATPGHAMHDARAWLARERERGRAPPTPHSIAHCCWRI